MKNLETIQAISTFFLLICVVILSASEDSCKSDFYSLDVSNNILDLNCFSNYSGEFNIVKNCDLLSQKVSKFYTLDCTTKDILAFIDGNENFLTNSIEFLEFNLHTNQNKKVIQFNQELFAKFPLLSLIKVKHADLELSRNKIVWPKNFNELEIHNSAKNILPPIRHSNIKKLKIDTWPNLQSISGIKYFDKLEILTLSKIAKITDLPSETFLQNGNLLQLHLQNFTPLFREEKSLKGLEKLSTFSFETKNIFSMPSTIFASTTLLKEINWSFVECTASPHLGNLLLNGLNLTRFRFGPKHKQR